MFWLTKSKVTKEQVKNLKEIHEKLQQLVDLFESYLERMGPPERAPAPVFVKAILASYFEDVHGALVFGRDLTGTLITFLDTCPIDKLRLIFNPKDPLKLVE